MKPGNFYKLIVISIIGLLVAVFLAAPWAAQAQTPSTAFTYQGRLRSNGVYVDGVCSFEFRLYDAASGGSQLGPTVSRTGVPVTKGSFAVLLDFGSVFSGTVRYLQINNVNCGLPGDPVSMTSRVALNPAPYALYAASANAATAVKWSSIITATMPLGFADGIDNGLTTVCALNQGLIYNQTSGLWTCAAVLDSHDSLQGLNDDDHPQYLLVNGSRPMSGTLNLNSNRVINLAPATASGQAVPFEQAVKVSDLAGGDLTGTYPNPEVNRLNNHPIVADPPALNQVFTWDGSQWQPEDPGAGGPASGDLSGAYPDPRVARIQGEAVADIDPTTGQVLCYNNAALRWEPTDVIKNSDTAGGDLSGTYPAPTVARLQGRDISATAPTNGYVLGWNGSAWAGAASGVAGAAGGDLNGTYPNPTVDGLQSHPVSSNPPTTSQLLTWNGAQWAPANVSVLQDNQPVANIAPTTGYALQWKKSQWETGDVVIPGDAAGGSLAGTYPNPRIANNAVGMAQLNLPMGFGYATMNAASGLKTGFNYILPTDSTYGFMPTVAGKCLVSVQSFISSGGSASATPTPYLKTGMVIDTTQTPDGGIDMGFSYGSSGEVGGDLVAKATANYVWNVSPSTQPIKFGCRVWLPTTDWTTDETVHCRVMYICQ